MAQFEIPLTPQQQQFSIELAGVSYGMVMRWANTPVLDIGGWYLDLYADGAVPGTDAPIIGGIPLVTGANLLEQYDYLDLGGALVVRNDEDPGVVPDFTNLGTTTHLLFLTGADALAAVNG